VRKSRKLLRRNQRNDPQARLVVSGCFATLEGALLTKDGGVDLVVANGDKDRLAEIAAETLALPTVPDRLEEPEANPLFARGRQRAFVKVQDGCRYRCAFCIVTLARGEERSRPVAEVVDEVNRLASEGVREVVLTGVHLGGWGSDLGLGLDKLLRAVLSETEVPRVRMGSLEPWELSERFWRLFEDPRLMPHLHLPVQSGADSVLRRMARRCQTSELAELARGARERVADLNLTTDIIAGFPGETDAEWRKTMDFVASVGFGHVHTFSYSARSGTKAAAMPGQVAAEVKKERSREMHALARRMRRETLGRYAGRRVPVLVEGRFGGGVDGDWFGYTPNYLPVRVASKEKTGVINRILDVQLDRVHEDGESLIGHL
jgi:threonylcarbamoyladenosine tRNA methylthiotransferase MtaB